MNSNRELMQRCSQAAPHGVRQTHPTFADHVENCRVWDVEGCEYLDLVGGIVAFNTGHLYPKVVTVVEAQSEKLSHICFQVLAHEPYLELCRIIDQRVLGNFAKKTPLVTTGSEAMESVVKIVRAITKRSGTIAFNGVYHGRTYYTLVLTGRVSLYPADMGLMPGHVYYALYPCPLYGMSEGDAIISIHRVLKNDVALEDTTAIVIELIQGEDSSYVVLPVFMQRLRVLCGEYEIMLTVDEVQGDTERTDTLFAMEQTGVAPDLTILARSIAGGFLLVGVTGRVEVVDAVASGDPGGTYTSNLIAYVVALEALEVSEQEGPLQKASDLRQRLKDGLLAIAEKHPEVGDIRGLGAMIATELFGDGGHDKPDVKPTAEVMARTYDKDLVSLSCGPYYSVLRTLIPLIIEDAQIRQGLEIISQCFDKAKQQRRSYAGGDVACFVRPMGIQVGQGIHAASDDLYMNRKKSMLAG